MKPLSPFERIDVVKLRATKYWLVDCSVADALQALILTYVPALMPSDDLCPTPLAIFTGIIAAPLSLFAVPGFTNVSVVFGVRICDTSTGVRERRCQGRPSQNKSDYGFEANCRRHSPSNRVIKVYLPLERLTLIVIKFGVPSDSMMSIKYTSGL
jgi:hypothetical protein